MKRTITIAGERRKIIGERIVPGTMQTLILDRNEVADIVYGMPGSTMPASFRLWRNPPPNVTRYGSGFSAPVDGGGACYCTIALRPKVSADAAHEYAKPKGGRPTISHAKRQAIGRRLDRLTRTTNPTTGRPYTQCEAAELEAEKHGGNASTYLGYLKALRKERASPTRPAG